MLNPKLRFPEFRNAPGWKKTLLKDVLTEHGLKSDGVSEVHSVSVHKGVINQKEHLGRSFAAADTSNYNLAKPYDIIYTKSPTGDFPFGVVKQNKLTYNVIVSPLYGVFKPINGHLGYILDSYFESRIRTNNYLAPIIKKGAKNTILITNETFISKGLYIPLNEKEQQKIADCLISIDELIVAQSKKVAALKAHKKGIMQQLFPREGENKPRLRFPEFHAAREWEYESLGQMGSFIRGITYAPSDVSTAGLLVLRSGNIQDGVLAFGRDLVFVDKACDPDLLLRAGDIAVCMSNGSKALVGKSAEYLHSYSGKVTIGAFCSLFRPQKPFSRVVFQSEQYSAFVAASIRGGNINNLKNSTLESFQFPVPPTLPEQHKVLDCLSSLNDLIGAQAQKLEALKTHKKGLMQQLFPSLGEVDA